MIHGFLDITPLMTTPFMQAISRSIKCVSLVRSPSLSRYTLWSFFWALRFWNLFCADSCHYLCLCPIGLCLVCLDCLVRCHHLWSMLPCSCVLLYHLGSLPLLLPFHMLLLLLVVVGWPSPLPIIVSPQLPLGAFFPVYAHLFVNFQLWPIVILVKVVQVLSIELSVLQALPSPSRCLVWLFFRQDLSALSRRLHLPQVTRVSPSTLNSQDCALDVTRHRHSPKHADTLTHKNCRCGQGDLGTIRAQILC